jgi:hypothetical protein
MYKTFIKLRKKQWLLTVIILTWSITCPWPFLLANLTVYLSHIGTCSYLIVGGRMSYLRYLCLCACSGIQPILCCVFVFLCHVYPMLPVSLDCSFFRLPLRYYLTFITLFGFAIFWPWASPDQGYFRNASCSLN